MTDSDSDLDSEARPPAPPAYLIKLTALTGKQRLELLTDDDDAQALVQTLPPELLYRTVIEVGIADATALVQLASAEQFQSLVDLGSWDRDQLDPHRLLTWIRAARGDEPEEFIAKLQGIDLELLELLLRSFTVVHSLEEDPDVNPDGITIESPDGAYLIELTVDGAEAAAMRTLLNDLFAQGPFEASRLLESARWELMGELLETAYRFRVARLADLGFPDPETAVSLFAYLDPEPHRAPPVAANGTEAVRGLARPAPPRFLDAVWGQLPEAVREQWEASLRTVVNSAGVAEGADPGDLEAIRRVAENVRDTLSIGWEWTTGGDPALSARALGLPVRTLFQLGFSLALKLKYRADRWARQPGALLAKRLWLMPEEAAVVSALRRKRPLRGLRVPGADPVPFRNLKELAEAAEALERAEGQRALFVRLLRVDQGEASALQTLALLGEATGPEELLSAAVAQALLAQPALAVPLREEMLPLLVERLFEVELGAGVARVKGSAREVARARLSDGLAPPAAKEAARLADERLALFCEAWGPAFKSEGRVDPKDAALTVPLEPSPSP